MEVIDCRKLLTERVGEFSIQLSPNGELLNDLVRAPTQIFRACWNVHKLQLMFFNSFREGLFRTLLFSEKPLSITVSFEHKCQIPRSTMPLNKQIITSKFGRYTIRFFRWELRKYFYATRKLQTHYTPLASFYFGLKE